MIKLIKETSNGYEAIELQDKLFSEDRTIFFTGEVTESSCNQIIQELLTLDGTDHNEITVFINSVGGDVLSGLAVYDVMRNIKSPITTVAAGLAASMGSIIFLGGDTRLMYNNSQIMIHDPSFGGGSYAGKKPDELRSVWESLAATRERLAEIIADRTGQPLDKVKDKTRKDSYFTAEEAVQFGLTHKIINSQKGE